ncbi:MAG: DUF2974 domain-containing protein [Lachnospiraceae bacterium]|nr:DUF2974 domain-containing protein [Lachnospiraceae bacterium]
MANIEDYIKWRGDLTFDVDPFNEVDNLILAQLAYTDFGGIVPAEKSDPISLKDASKMFFEMHTDEEIMNTVMTVKVAPYLMPLMLESERFKRLKLCAYVSETDNETQIQFSVVTFLLPDNTYYVAFRGTDRSMIGWKEDFNMSYLYETPAQKAAVQYINENFKRSKKPLRVGGHSKGGNLAVFASSFCLESIQERIITVYTNDGPGFREEVLSAPGYNRILPRIVSIVPDQTFISSIQSHKEKHNYVKSSEKGGINQHDAMTWQVLGNRFEHTVRSGKAEVVNKAMHEWLSGISDEKRERFVDILFDVLMSDGVDTADDLMSGGLKGFGEKFKRIKELDKEDQKILFDVFLRFSGSMESKAAEHLVKSAKEKIKTIDIPAALGILRPSEV